MAPTIGIIEVRLSDEDRGRFGGPEWVRLDLDKLWETPSARLERWEAELGGNRSIAGAVALTALGTSCPAWARRCVVWVARKQAGENRHNEAGTAETYDSLAEIQAMRVRIRDWVDPDAPADLDEPEEGDGDDPPGLGTSEPGTPPT